MADSLVVVYTASGRLEADMVKMFLNSEGIPAEAIQESYGITLGLTVGELGKADILVPFEFEQSARKLIEEMQNDLIASEEDEPSDNDIEEQS
jgi:Putative prokaryotic signal transducing protein